MPLDFAGLSALSGVSPWAEIRAEKAQDLQRVALLDAMQKQGLAKQQESFVALQEQMNSVNQLHVLDKDREAIQAKSKELAKSIAEGVNQYHGNVEKYLNSGGKLDLYKYNQNLANSEEVQRGLMNAYAHTRYLDDVQKGLTPRMTAWDGGQGTYEQNYQDYESGKTKSLNYRGAYQRPDLGDLRKSFSEVYGKNRYNPEEVDVPTLYQKVLIESKNKGLSEQDARDNASRVVNEYQQTVKAGAEPYRFKSDDINKIAHQRKMEDLSYLNLMLKAKKQQGATPDLFGDIYGGGYGQKDAKGEFPTYKVNAEGYYHSIGMQPPQGVQPDSQIDVPTSITKTYGDTNKKILETYGLRYDKKAGGWVGNLPNGQAYSPKNMMPFPADLNSLPFKVTDVLGTQVVKDPNGKLKPFTIMELQFPDESTMDKLGAMNYHGWKTLWTIPDSETAAGQGNVDTKKNTVKVLVPAPTDEMFVRQLNYKGSKEDNSKFDSELDPYLEPVQTDEE